MTPTKTPRERFEQMKLQDDITFVTHKMSAKLWDVAIDDMWECVWSHVSALLEEARQDAREEVITYISKDQWWEETEDNYRELFWFAPKYSSL